VLFGWVGAVVGPLLLAWALVTLLHWAVEVLPGSISALYVSASHRADHDAFAAERSRRRALAASSGKIVAVTLSGGGYRAAAAHAGALSILDAAGIPVSVLSTVSGGSIAGAAYAQGWTPECFAAYLRRRKPGLPDDLLSITAVIGDLVRRDWGSGDVYATHFGRRYFHDHTIAETGPPDLVVNVTDYDTGDRVAIMKGREVSAGTRSPADALPLRTVVAASGAFPVAFQPVSIYGARYVDGGVVENLGVTGLSRYVAATGRAPDVLIVSDLGAEPQRPHRSYKPSPFQMAVQAPDLTSRALHEILYRTYSNGRYDRAADMPPEQPFRVERATLWPGVHAGGEVAVFFLAPTSPAERRRFNAGRDRERLAAVAAFRTLQELEPAQVDAAFWAGAALARDYLPDIRRALGNAAGDMPLPPVPAAPTCPR
jgi:predicted acylesterase/phospholipase RssA